MGNPLIVPVIDPQRTVRIALQDAYQQCRRALSGIAVAAGLECDSDRLAAVRLAQAQLMHIVSLLESLVQT